MTTFESLVEISMIRLRARGEWQRGATAYDDIDAAVNAAADMLRGDDMPDIVDLGLINMAISELKRRAASRAYAMTEGA